MGEHHTYTNRLINEKSPYLQQHAHNPVDWYPWGEEAFAASRTEDKPIFLSIGYSTCHWCHVMEAESFENVEIAKLMNENFINVKVDREEHPEVDSLYMEFAQSLMSGSAGWPLNVLLTPDLEPFFATTYLPPHANHHLMGLAELITQIREVWSSDDREDLLQQAEKIVDFFASHVHITGEEIPEKDQVELAADMLLKLADPVYGGMRGSPKFPIGYQWSFLMHYASKSNDGRPLFLAERTLDKMQHGGIYDHLGGGFSRYSVDQHWLVPHFEKMLYDNALLAFAYLEAWQITQRPFYRNVCEEILNYVLRDMTHPDGGFYSAEDADSEGHEGYFYTWTLHEVQQVLGEESSELFCAYYDITPSGNFDGRNILNTPLSLDAFASQKHRDQHELSTLFAKQRSQLWSVREKRIHPLKDDKILSSWNGLMIFSLVQAGAAFTDHRFVDAAVKAARFIKENMWIQGVLLRRWRQGEGLHHAGLDEYAFMIRGLISLFEVGAGTEWLDWAIELESIVHKQFKSDKGAFYQTDGQDPHIILRRSQFQDGAEPSGNAIHCENLLRLYQLTNNQGYVEQAEDILKAVNMFIETYPLGYCYHMMNLMRYYDEKAATVVIALNEKEEFREKLLAELYQSFHWHCAIIWRKVGDESLLKLIPSVADQKPIAGKTTLYICHHGACHEPITDIGKMIAAIHEI